LDSTSDTAHTPRRKILPSADQEKILHHLFDNPEDPQWKIAEVLSLTEPKVKHAIDDMKERKWITSGYSVDLRSLGYALRYRVDIWVAPRQLQENTGGMKGDFGITTQKKLARYIINVLPKKTRFSGSILVEDVRILLGSPADMSATVLAKDTDSMFNFVTEGLRMCGAIYQTSSCEENYSVRREDPNAPDGN
jgi:DNA-binding Lrp family transcriptional regulator